jgi:hypothetical protein
LLPALVYVRASNYYGDAHHYIKENEIFCGQHLGVCRVASQSFQLVVACTVRYLSMDKNRRKRPLFATLVTETRVFLNYTCQAREVSGHQSNLEEIGNNGINNDLARVDLFFRFC